MRRSRRVRQPPPDLTSLFDVLFIVVFASLIRAAAVQNAAAHPVVPPPKPVLPAPPQPIAVLKERALADLQADLSGRTPLVIRVTAGTEDKTTWSITALEVGDKHITLDAPLLEHSLDPDITVAYLGDRSADLRICKIAALHLGEAELAGYLVIIAPSAPLADLPHALFDGLHRDLDRCLTEQHGFATLVPP